MGARHSLRLDSLPEITAEMATKHAEAAAITQRASAEVAKLHSEAQRASAEAAAVALRASAEAAAVALRASAEIAKLQSEMAANTAAYFIFRKKALKFGVLSIVGVCVLAAGGLAADYVYHESAYLIKRRMRKTLESEKPPINASPMPTVKLPVRQPPLVPTSKLTLVMGPSGCGKSTLLADTARELVSRTDADGKPKEPTPCVLISIRLDASRGRLATLMDQNAATVFDEIAAKILGQIGYPTRHAFLHILFPQGIQISGEVLAAPIMFPRQAERVTRALELFFEVAAEICREREARGIPRAQAAPVLLWDEMHDLVKDSRFAKAGGAEVFAFLARHLVDYGASKKLVRPAAAGSSGQLQCSLKDAGIVSGEHYEEYSLGDPPEDVVRAALQNRGYAAAEATKIVTLCGTRMLMLEKPLTDAHLPDADSFIAQREIKALTQFQSLLQGLTPADTKAVVSLIDDIELAAAKGRPRPSLGLIPVAVNASDFSRIAFITVSGGLIFQSRIHRRVWSKHRALLLEGQTVAAADELR